MARLDYVLVSDYAQWVEGKLTVVGGSYTSVTVDVLGSTFQTWVSGRIILDPGVSDAVMRIVVRPPESDYEVSTSMLHIIPNNVGDPDKGIIGFAQPLLIPITAEGLYSILVEVDSVLLYELSFEAKCG